MTDPTPERVLSLPHHCDWCGTALFADFERYWRDRRGDFVCPANADDQVHEPAERQP